MDDVFSACNDEDDDSLFSDDDGSISDQSKGSVEVAKEDIALMNVVRAIVLMILLTIAFITAEIVFVIFTTYEDSNFDNTYQDASQQIIDGFYGNIENKLWTAQTLSTDLSSSANGEWPFVTFANFEARCNGPRHLSGASTITFSPLIRRIRLAEWQEYAELSYPLQNSTFVDAYYPHENHPHENSTEPVAYYPTNRDIEDGIYHFIDSVPSSDFGIADFSFPIWQMAPSLGNASTDLVGIMFNEMTNAIRGEALEGMLLREGGVMSQFQYQDSNGTDFASYNSPRSTIYYPLYGSLDTDKVIVGSLDMEVQWEAFLEDILDEADNRPLLAVVDNSCGGTYSYSVLGVNASYIGSGDLHSEIEGYEPTSSSYEAFAAIFDDHGTIPLSTESACGFRVSVYATSDFKGEYNTSLPGICQGIVLAVLLSIAMIFCVYDRLVERRQLRVVDAAERSDAIVRSFFPSAVRNRLYENAKQKSADDKESLLLNTSSKHRLKNFMKGAPGEAGGQGGSRNEPIADLFPNTTILFADISGFTAWSSEREPSQVFILLETLYRAMDKAAKRLGVFKVETVGDCYVAATGIPEPQKNHAQIMARFARTTLIKINRLTKDLEAQLGPGTADLAMRFGVHSGPVTAGVLRGQKSRFQLFGDTMNTASRIETSGIKNKIHLSQETADLLTASGHRHWFVPREGTVSLKGKGECQTYWLSLAGDSSSYASSAQSDDFSDTESRASREFKPKWNGRVNQVLSILEGSNLADVMGLGELDSTVKRLVDWNTDVLLRCLEGVEARRNAERVATGKRIVHVPLSIETQTGGSNLVLDEVQMVIALPDYDEEIAARAAQENVFLSAEVQQELRDYVTCIASGYKKNSFHNFEHASHVILSANKLLKRIVAPDQVGNKKQEITSRDLHEYTYGIGTDPIAQLAVVFSALIHDVGHTGVPNGQLAREDPALAEKYIHKSVAEQRSVDVAWELLMLPHFKNLRASIYQDEDERRRFRHLVVNSVMATDIFDKELKALRESRWDIAFHSKEHDSDIAFKHHKATIVIEHIIQASDVSHTMQHWHIYKKWNERLFREMYFSYLSGRSEKDPSKGWYEGELWFFDFYVIPLARKLEECGVFGVSSDEYLNYALQNRNEWERKGRDVSQDMLASATKEAEKCGLLDTIEEADDTDEDTVEEVLSSKETEVLGKYAGYAAVKDESQNSETSTLSLNASSSTNSFSLRQIKAPPGRLGIVIDTTAEGPVVHSVQASSPMRLKLFAGDVITSIDGVETSSLSSEAVAALLSVKADQERCFLVARHG